MQTFAGDSPLSIAMIQPEVSTPTGCSITNNIYVNTVGLKVDISIL